jgi:hypothetical protein
VLARTSLVALLADSDATLLYQLSDPGGRRAGRHPAGTGEAGCELGIDVALGILEMFGRDDAPVTCDPEMPSGAEAWPTEFLAGNEPNQPT